jgi:hypothetical protein
MIDSSHDVGSRPSPHYKTCCNEGRVGVGKKTETPVHGVSVGSEITTIYGLVWL